MNRQSGCITFVLPIIFALIVGGMFIRGYVTAANELNRINEILEDEKSDTVTAHVEKIDTLMAKMGKTDNVKFKFITSYYHDEWVEVTMSMDPKDIDKLYENSEGEDVTALVKTDARHPDCVANEELAEYAEVVRKSQLIQMIIISGAALIFIIIRIVIMIVASR